MVPYGAFQRGGGSHTPDLGILRRLDVILRLHHALPPPSGRELGRRRRRAFDGLLLIGSSAVLKHRLQVRTGLHVILLRRKHIDRAH